MRKITKNSVSISSKVVLIVALALIGSCDSSWAQVFTAFSHADKFGIPELNAAIIFAANGTYGKAKLENGTWDFEDLCLNGSLPLDNLKVSVQNSNVTISSYRTSNTTFWSARLRYVVEGQGKQTFNLGLDSKNAEWNVIFNGVYRVQGDGWIISPDDTLTITGATGNVTIACYNFINSGVLGDRSNLPFYEQHSVAIITVVAVVTTTILAVAIMRRKQKTPALY